MLGTAWKWTLVGGVEVWKWMLVGVEVRSWVWEVVGTVWNWMAAGALGTASSCMLDMRSAAALEASLPCVASGSEVAATVVVVAVAAVLARRLVREMD